MSTLSAFVDLWEGINLYAATFDGAQSDGGREKKRAFAIAEIEKALAKFVVPSTPIPMLLWCPQCGERHMDVGEFATKSHHTHACQDCGMVWRPAIVPTVGVFFLPGFKNEERTPESGTVEGSDGKA